MLQYITDNKSRRSVEDQVKEVLSAGCAWIQLSVDGLQESEVRRIVEKIMPECVERQAFLTFRNHVELAKEINVGGVVVNPADVFPSQARATLGAAAIVGVEVHDSDQIPSLTGLDIDYVAIRPFRHIDGCTLTPLGIDGTAEICRYMENRELELPRVASGGVTFNDIAPLMDAGCNGVAMSEALADAPDIAAETARCIELLKIYEQREQDKLKQNS